MSTDALCSTRSDDPAPPQDRACRRLQQETLIVRAELARVDAKAALLVSLAGGGLALTATAPLAPLGRQITAGLFAAATTALLAAVLPRIPRRGGTGFVAHARAASPAALLAQLGHAETEADDLAIEVWRLSRLTCAKYRIIRIATWLLILGVTALVIALGVRA